ncbi:MAG: hypothetical protein IPO70_08655 [Bacteroidetes bacterium]|nr:hypothetical protein [Bacteroidota bacterium]
MKLSRSNRQVGKYGGLVPILKRIEQCRIAQLITSELGSRVKQAEYSHADTILGWSVSAFCGGKRINYVSKITKELKLFRGLRIPSHDTIGRELKKLAHKDERVKGMHNDAQNYIYYNDNLRMNRLLMKTTKQIGALRENVSYTLDVDATFINSECRGVFRPSKEQEEKYDNEKALKENQIQFEGKEAIEVELKKVPTERTGKTGFCPMVALIGALPVNISLRSASGGAHFKLHEFVKSTFTLADESKITIGRFISDGAGYLKNTLEYLHNRDVKFLVRFTYKKTNKKFAKAFKEYSEWKKATIKTTTQTLNCEVGEIPYKMWDHPQHRRGYPSPTYRVIVLKRPTDDTLKLNDQEAYKLKLAERADRDAFQQMQRLEETGNPNADGWTEINGYKYIFIITNDFDKAPQDLAVEYNKRGNAERQFSHMKKDFAWKYPPFMYMNANAVFLIVAAIANNIFRGVAIWLNKQIPQIDLKATLEEFSNLFVRVCFEVIDDDYVYFTTEIAFEKIKM